MLGVFSFIKLTSDIQVQSLHFSPGEHWANAPPVLAVGRHESVCFIANTDRRPRKHRPHQSDRGYARAQLLDRFTHVSGAENSFMLNFFKLYATLFLTDFYVSDEHSFLYFHSIFKSVITSCKIPTYQFLVSTNLKNLSSPTGY